MDNVSDYKLHHVEQVDAHARECARIARVTLNFALDEGLDPAVAVQLAEKLAVAYWLEFYPGRRSGGRGDDHTPRSV